MLIRLQLLSIIGLLAVNMYAGGKLSHVEPPHWWTGMQETRLQILVHGTQIGLAEVRISHPQVTLQQVHKVENPNYLFLDVSIPPQTRPGMVTLHFKPKDGPGFDYSYELKARDPQSAERIGFGAEDVLYLLMPDRFANGDPGNDNIAGMREIANRQDPDGRHGGDMRGIRNQISYLEKLGITGLWINPLLENNMPRYSYHGYAITDFYRIDPRFGSHEEYLLLSRELKNRGIKLIKDMVFNHCGSLHWWMEDLPAKDWVHQFPTFTRSNYRSETLMDPWASGSDRYLMQHGWFDVTMPDLNQRHPLLANYLIQNSVWWIEEAGLGGIRMDTYPYADQDFMSKWVQRIRQEYPRFTILGETWLQTEAHTAYFQNTTYPQLKPANNLHYLTDFPLHYAMTKAFVETDNWTDGLSRLYYVLSKDFLYENPFQLITFPDNHDLERYYTSLNQDFDAWKMGMAFLFTTRGIPMIYYGTEYLDQGSKKEGDAMLRKDVPGGWAGDLMNVFTGAGMERQQMEAMKYMEDLIRIRRTHPALQSGQLTHYIPFDGTYVYFRTLGEEVIMTLFNNKHTDQRIVLARFAESMGQAGNAENLLDGKVIALERDLNIPARTALILKLKP